MKILIIENIVDVAEKRAKDFGFNIDEVDIAYKRDDAIKLLTSQYYDVIFLDILLAGKNWTDVILILEEIFMVENRHGAVFLVSQLAEQLNSDKYQQLSRQIESFPIMSITSPLEEDSPEPSEYKHIRKIINLIKGTINRHPSIDNHDLPTKGHISKEVLKFFITISTWIIGLFLIPYLLKQPLFNNTSSNILIIISSIPGILAAIIIYWDKINILIKPVATLFQQK
jgi:CheY-like chemotaxis protein